MTDFSQLKKDISIDFTNDDLLDQVFVHKSYLNENEGKESNERLEFLGDAVLELVVTDFLYKKFEDLDEGVLTSYRSALVRGTNLAKIAKKIDLGSYLYLSNGEERSGGREKDYLLANTVEALIGAIYLDQGYATAENFISTFINSTIDEIIREGLYLDAKTHFQEKSQEVESVTPHYVVVEESGPDHEKEFTIAAMIGETEAGRGVGASKQDAQQEAARNALKNKGWL